MPAPNLTVVTSARTVTPADDSATFALGGAAYYAVTLPTPTGFVPFHQMDLINTDVSPLAAKLISAPGYQFKLWPGQRITVWVANGLWMTTGPIRWRVLTSGGLQPLYVDHALGSDTLNDGLVPDRPLATIDFALKTIKSEWDAGGSQGFVGNPTIQLAQGAFTEQVTALGPMCPGSHAVTIVGDQSHLGNVIWRVGGPAGSVGLHVHDFGCVVSRGLKFEELDSTAPRIAVCSSQQSVLALGDIEWGQFTGGQHINIANSIVCLEGGAYNISGSAAYHSVMSGQASFVFTNQTVGLPNAISFTQFLSITGPGEFVAANVSYTGHSPGSIVGQTYGAGLGAAIQLNGAILPGTMPGFAAPGAYVSP